MFRGGYLREEKWKGEEVEEREVRTRDTAPRRHSYKEPTVPESHSLSLDWQNKKHPCERGDDEGAKKKMARVGSGAAKVPWQTKTGKHQVCFWFLPRNLKPFLSVSPALLLAWFAVSMLVPLLFPFAFFFSFGVRRISKHCCANLEACSRISLASEIRQHGSSRWSSYSCHNPTINCGEMRLACRVVPLHG